MSSLFEHTDRIWRCTKTWNTFENKCPRKMIDVRCDDFTRNQEEREIAQKPCKSNVIRKLEGSGPE